MWLSEVALLGLGLAGTYWVTRQLTSSLDPNRVDAARQKRNQAWLREKFPHRQDIKLEGHEEHIVTDVLDPHEINVGLGDIGGLGDQIEGLREIVLRPLQNPQVRW